MTRKARTLKWTALAVATALIAAPAAYSGGKLPVANKVKVSTLSPAAAKAAKEQPQKYDRFIVTYREGARRLSAAAGARLVPATHHASRVFVAAAGR